MKTNLLTSCERRATTLLTALSRYRMAELDLGAREQVRLSNQDLLVRVQPE